VTHAPPDTRTPAGHGAVAHRVWRVAVCLVVLLTTLGAARADPAARVKEAQIKAAFLYNFTKFVEWPATSFATPADDIVVGLLGDSLLREPLESTVKDRRVNGRCIVVRRVVTIAEIRATHVLFVDAAEEARLSDLRSKLADSAVLLVGESENFLANGGSIRLVLEAQRLRFEINATAAERAGVKISSQLQKLALAVHRLP
jgi:hypothetical protein